MKLKRFQGTQVNLSVLLEKEISCNHHGTLNTEFLEPSCTVSPKTKSLFQSKSLFLKQVFISHIFE